MRVEDPTALRCEPEHGCITCGDEAIALRVVTVDESGLALCEDELGRHTTIEVALIGPVAPGDGLLAHAGTAIAQLPREEVPA